MLLFFKQIKKNLVLTSFQVRQVSHTIASGIQPIQNLSVLTYLGDERKAEWGHHWINKGFHSECKLGSSLYSHILLISEIIIYLTFRS